MTSSIVRFFQLSLRFPDCLSLGRTILGILEQALAYSKPPV